MNATRITSAANPRIKLWASLRDSKARAEHGLFMAEGVKVIRTACEAGWSATALLLDEDKLDRIPGELPEADECLLLPSALMKKVCVSDTPQGAAAIFPLPAPRLPRASGPLLALAAEGVQDPGNLGALVRVAAGAGFDEFIAAGSCADVWSPKVIRGSAGLVFKLETSAVSSEQLESFALETKASVYAATGHGGSDYRAIAPAERSILLIGSEGQGLSERWSRHAQVYIPMKPGCESLNAAVAAGVIAFAFAGALGRI